MTARQAAITLCSDMQRQGLWQTVPARRICTTGIGISISANKVKGIRCALCSDPLSAKMTRLHNDANMLAMGAGIVGENLALEIVETFLNTPFSGEERHSRRISLIEEV